MDGNTSPIIDSDPHKERRGFTLVEIVVTTAIGILIIGTVAIIGISYIRNRELQAVANTLVSYLRTASVRAMQSEGNAAQGVSRADGKLTLFRGSTYAARQTAYDEIRPYPDYIQFTGLTEVDFAKQTGLPSTTGSFNLTNGFMTATVTVNSTGTVSK